MVHSIKQINKEYFQKSMFFLYPMLKVPPSVEVKPECTYMSWEDKYDVDDKRLICLFPEIGSSSMRKYHEKKYLIENRRYETMHPVEGGKTIYVFDFSNLSKDWTNLIAGNYSKLSTSVKLSVTDFFRMNPKTAAFMDSYIRPEKYYEVYAKLLNVDVELLKEGVELLGKPDMSREKLLSSQVNLEMSV